MQLPEWIKPALVGAGVGAVVLAIVGFSWGGWVTGGSAQELADEQTTAAVAAALTPYCVEKSRTDPNRIAIREELDDASSYKRQGIIEDSGWATPMGEDSPNRMLARSCLTALLADS